LWVNAFGDANRQLTRYRDGRVLYAGDAAHQQMPVGGQALNLGLQDAVNLGWKLAAAAQGWAPAGLLDTYHAERHAVGRRVLANIRAQASLLLGGAEVEPVRTLLGELLTEEPVRARLAGMISGLDIRYPTDGGDHPLLGARLPDTELILPRRRTSTTVLLRSGRGLLLDPGTAETASIAGLAGPWGDRVLAVAARPEPGGQLPEPDAVLVRPDGHVAWVGSERDGAFAALRRWFGPSAPGL
jgi:oxygenase